MRTIALLTISNIFMTFAWYGHLKYREVPLYKVIVLSWLIAFFEYCFQVPANRIGSYEFSAAQLKTIQEVITLTVFAVFSVLYLKQPLRWNYLVGFALIVVAVAVIFWKWGSGRVVFLVYSKKAGELCSAGQAQRVSLRLRRPTWEAAWAAPPG